MKYTLFALFMIGFTATNCFADGCISGNCVNGNGTYVWSSGGQYSGDWQNQQRTGHGTYTYATGEVFTGSWINNQKHGQGMYTWPGGYQFIGTWRDNAVHGEGIYTYPDGTQTVQVLNMGQLVSEKLLNAQVPPSQDVQGAPASTPITPPSLPSGRRWKKAN